MNNAAEIWDAEAATFDLEADHGLADPRVRHGWANLLVPLAEKAPTEVADLGCGTGSLSLLFAEAGHRVSGVDVSPQMIERARAKASAARVAVSFEVGDAAFPPYKQGTFGLVIVRHVLWSLDDPEAVVGRWVALLRPGGVLVLVEGSWHTGAGLTAAQCRAFVLAHRDEADVVVLNDRPELWGGPVDDERFLLVSRS